MRLGALLYLLGLCAVAAGCGVLEFGSKNVLESPLNEFSDLAEDCRNRRQADKAWREFQNANPEQLFSVHFMRGFKDGFADYLFAGGTGSPPVAPPWRYRKVGYETPQGVQAVEDWFTGFRQGVAGAQAGGLRQLVIVPVSLTGAGPVPVHMPAPPGRDATEMLPMPRISPPDAKDALSVPKPE